jgi:PAS domain S-box-containing protein
MTEPDSLEAELDRTSPQSREHRRVDIGRRIGLGLYFSLATKGGHVSERDVGVFGEGAPLERIALDSIDRAVIITSPDGHILLWNRGAEHLYGWSEEEVRGRLAREVLVPDHQWEVAQSIVSSVVTGQAWKGDFAVLHRSGELVRVHVSDHPILDAQGNVIGVVGISEDVSGQRQLERQAASVADHLALALEAGGLGTWRWDIATGLTEWDPKLEQLFGLQPGEFTGTFEAWRALLHPDDAEAAVQTVNDAVQNKRPYLIEHRVVWPDGTIHWLQGKGAVTLDASGEVTGTIGCTADVTEQMQLRINRQQVTEMALEMARKERESRERVEFLGRVNEVLANSFTRQQVMRNVTSAAVPRLGDWCAIFVLSDENPLNPEIEIAHVDPEMVAYAKKLQEQFPYDPSAPTGIPAVIRSGRSEFFPEIDEVVLADTPTEVREVVKSLRLKSAIAVPLLKRNRVIGAMQFVNSVSSRPFTSDDVALAEAVGGRIASALDNVRLSENQRMIARTLQASLLPDILPEIPGVQVAVRYWAASEGTEVGGDFYDVFEVGDHYGIVIGDVCGTGPVAASMTGLARHTIRASAWQGADPSEVLRQLNNAMLRSDRSTFCTALFAAIFPTKLGMRIEMASGGHPLPIVHRVGDKAETLGTPGTLLGIFSDSHSSIVSEELAPGDTLVLYTDGVTDVRPPSDLSVEQFQEIIETSSAQASSAEELVDLLGSGIMDVLPPEKRKDDIALLVMRVASREVDTCSSRPS